MAIEYYLQNNPLTPETDDQSARILPKDVLDNDAIVSRMIKRGTTVTRTDIVATLNLLFEVISDEVAAGNHVNLPVAGFRPGLSGRFNNDVEEFDRSLHTKRALVFAGSQLKKAVANAPFTKVKHAPVEPEVNKFIDFNSGTTNDEITPTGVGRIKGDRLKFDPSNPADGIYLIRTDDGSAVKVAVLSDRTNTNLSFNLPGTGELAPGDYRLEVRRSFGEENPQVRIGALSHVLTVA